MDKEDNYSAPNFSTLENDHHYHHHHHQNHNQINLEENQNGDGLMVNYLLNNLPQTHTHQPQQLSFADVMQFADFGPKLALHQTRIPEEHGVADGNGNGDGDDGDSSVFFLKFPVLNDKNFHVVCHDEGDGIEQGLSHIRANKGKDIEIMNMIGEGEEHDNSLHLQFLGEDNITTANNNNNNGNPNNNPSGTESEIGNNIKKSNNNNNNNNKRKRGRSMKTTEEVESQRMTHIAVERNRRKQMNEHLRVLRSLMPGSYVQRGDQASIIGGAIEFVRELEQLLQCLESQKRRRLLGDQTPRPAVSGSEPGVVLVNNAGLINNHQSLPPLFPPNTVPLPDDMQMSFDASGGVREETAENKSCLADVEVKLLGFDAMIKILSRRRPGQLIKAIAALEDLQFNILHTNITTIEQTVLYSFNVKVTSESRFSAEDIASSVQQIFTFIHANSAM